MQRFFRGRDVETGALQKLVDAGFHRARRAFRIGLVIVVQLGVDHVAQRAGIGADDAVQAPLLHGDFAQDGVHGHGDVVHGVIGGHVGAGTAFDHAHAEGDGVVFAQQAGVEIGGRSTAAVLVAVGQEVLHERRRQPVLGIVALQSLDHGDHHLAVEIRVLAEALFGSSPARIAAQVGVRRPNHQAAAMRLLALLDVAGLVAFHPAGQTNQLRIPGFTHADFLRELRGRDRHRPAPSTGAAQRQAVQSFGVTRPLDTEARHAGIGPQTGDFFVQRHQGNDIGHALLSGQTRILKWIRRRLCAHQPRGQYRKCDQSDTCLHFDSPHL